LIFDFLIPAAAVLWRGKCDLPSFAGCFSELWRAGDLGCWGGDKSEEAATRFRVDEIEAGKGSAFPVTLPSIVVEPGK